MALLLVLMPGSQVWAASVEDLTYIIENDQVTITGCNTNATGELVIPDTIEGYPVTSIREEAFLNGVWGDYRFSSVVIPDSVTTIGFAAFSGCDKLTSVTLPQGLTTIDDATFQDCSSLTGITIPEAVTHIGWAAFSGCSQLSTVSFTGSAPTFETTIEINGVEEVDDVIFHSVTATVYYPANDPSWTEEVRQNYGGTLTWVSVCSHVPGDWVVKYEPTTTSTGRQVRYCTLCDEQVESETIPALTYTTNHYGPLTYTLYSNATVKITACNPLVAGKLVIPDTIEGGTVVTIGNKAFLDCDALTAVVLPSGLKRIEEYAFKECDKLTHITIPASVETILFEAFYYCRNLDTVEFLGNAPVFDLGIPDISDIPVDPDPWDELDDFVYSYEIFYGTNATGYYTAGDASWSDPDTLNCSMPSWKASCGSHTPGGWMTITEGTNTTQALEGQRCTGCGALLDARWVTADHKIITGTAGDSITWQLDQITGLLTISGEGDLTVSPWHSYASTIQRVHIEEGITGIGSSPFSNHSNLKYISIPDTVTAIDDRAFIGCNNLVYNIQEQNFDVNATAWYLGNAENPWHALVALRADDFDGDQRPAGMDYIFEFHIDENCKMIASCVDYISPRAEYYVYYERIRMEVYLPEGLTTIGDYAFQTVGSDDYNGYFFSFLSYIRLPDSLTTIGDYAFIHCMHLYSLSIPEAATNIGEGAFHHCSIRNITLPEGMTQIGDYGFYDSYYLTSITIPSGVTKVGAHAFESCAALETVTFTADAPQFSEDSFKDVTATVYYPANAAGWTEEVRQNYGGTLTWKPVCDTHTPGDWVIAEIEDETLLKDQLCAVCGEVMGSESVPRFVSGKCGIELLWKLDLGTGLMTVTGSGEMHYDNAAPWEAYREQITGLVVEEGALSIQAYAFMECPELVCVTLPQSMTSIGSYAFFECGALTEVTLPDELEQIGKLAFAYSGLTQITLPRGMAVMPNQLFASCTALTTVILPDDLTELPEGTFLGCSSLTTVTLPQRITAIGERAFHKCHALQELTIPASVTSVGSSAFYECEPETMTFLGDAPDFADDAFLNALTTVYYPGHNSTWDGKTNNYGGGLKWRPWYSVQPELTPKYPTVSFEEEVVMNVYFDAQNLEDVVQMGLITFPNEVAEWSVENARHVLPGYTYSEMEQLYCAETQGIPGAQMNQIMYFALYAQLSDGSYVYSNLLHYCPTTYAYNQLENETMRTLVVAMLNYGAAAQTYFGTNTDNLMNSSLTPEQLALVENYRSDMITPVTKVDATQQGSFAKTDGFGTGYPSVSFEGIFSINYYVMPEAAPVDGVTMYVWDQATVDSGAELTADNAVDAIAMMDPGSGTWQATVGDIAASRLDEGVYVAFRYSDGTTDYCSGVLPYSIGSYCATQATANTALSPFAQATAVYGYYAKQLFGA